MSERDNPYATGPYATGPYATGPYTTGESGTMRASAHYGAAPRAQPQGQQGLSGMPASGAAGANATDFVKDTTTAQFAADVIQESRRQPVLVDFWAPWCGPCKQLTPVLEKVVREAKGRVKLVKLNIDEHPSIPGQLGIQSIPAIIAFVNGQPVDGFMGALPESQVKQFIERLAGPAGADEQAAVDALLTQSQEALAAGEIERAGQGFSEILAFQPENLKAVAGLADTLVAAGQPAGADQLLEGLTDEQKRDPAIVGVLARRAQAREVEKLGDPAALSARLATNPDDHAARMDLAKILNVKGDRAGAAEHLLAIMRKDRSFEDDGARRALLSFFEAWGPTDPATIAARRKLSSILFA